VAAYTELPIIALSSERTVRLFNNGWSLPAGLFLKPVTVDNERIVVRNTDNLRAPVRAVYRGVVTAMDQQLDRKQLERKLEQRRRLSLATSDSTTSARLANLIEELEHSLRKTV
jgi:hypothetical protein